jgi:hypothetical protein
MRRAAFEPDARACGWAMRGMRSAVLLPWRRRGGAVGASELRCRCRFLFVSAISKRHWATRCARLRAIATVDPTGHVHRGQLSQQSDKMERRLIRPKSRCAEYCMKWLTWMLAPLMALGCVVSASATVRIHSDPGGRIDQYLDRYNQIRLSGQHVIVDGTCNSACTLLLGSLPRDKICFTEQASLGFHSAWQFDDSGRPVASPSWTRVLWRNYPRAIRTWIIHHGGLTPHMIFLRGEALAALYPRCTAAAHLNYQ